MRKRKIALYLSIATSILLSGCGSYNDANNNYVGLDPLKVAQSTNFTKLDSAEAKVFARFGASFLQLMQYVGIGGLIVSFGLLMIGVITGKVRSKEEIMDNLIGKIFIACLLLNAISVVNVIMKVIMKL